MWCLGCCLLILIGYLIPDEHPCWNSFLLLLDIVNELFAPETHPHKADYLSIMVGEFLEDFKEIYPNRPLTPIMHYMVHMPTWTKWYVLLISTHENFLRILIVSDVAHLVYAI